MPTEEITQDQQSLGGQIESAGTVLNRERQKRGLDEKQVADHLHITVHYVKAIEADNYDKLPGSIFAKGYIRSYAQFLGLDAEEIVSRYLELQEQNKPEKTQIKTPPRKPRRQRNLQWAVASVAVFSAVLITAWLISGDSQRNESAALEEPVARNNGSSGDIVQAEAEQPAEPVNILEQLAIEDQAASGRSATAAPVVQTPDAAPATAPRIDSEEAGQPQPIVSADGAEPPDSIPQETATEETITEETITESAVVPLEQPDEASENEDTDRLLADNDGADADAVAPASTVASDSTPAVPRPEDVANINVLQGANGERIIAVDANGEDVLRISFSGESWVEVKDGDARQIYRDLRQAGDVLEITGHAPFNILLGDAPLTSLHFNGDEIDVSDDIRIDNSARLTVGL